MKFLAKIAFGSLDLARYARPQSLQEALGLLAGSRWRVLAGGTDFYPAQGGQPIRDDVLDINGLSELRRIEETPHHFMLGARVNWTDLLRRDLPPAFDALKLAAREVGSVQIQNRGTIAGNICNASPAADGVPPLMVLDAEVELASLGGRRYVPLSDFILGNRKTALRPDELVTCLHVPKTSADGASHFLKLGARRYLVISIAMVAARIVLDDAGGIAKAAVSVGACSVVAQRLCRLEAALVGRRGKDEALAAVTATAFDELSPIDDVRGSAAYRLQAAREIVKRALAIAIDGASRTVTGRAAA